MTTQTRWQDLKTRTLSGVVIAVTALALLGLGGIWFHMLLVFVAGVMVWELWMMIHPGRPEHGMLMGALAASTLSGIVAQTDPMGVAAILAITPGIGMAIASRVRWVFGAFALGIQIACWGLIDIRLTDGIPWVLWLICVVIATDIAGYFAGRAFGGPKFWPSISPKKTWSGTAAGWICAALIGAAVMAITGAGWGIIPLSVALSFASQMGDIAESALKRHVGIKDSSTLIPGHGGVMDRFDGMLGAALFLMLVSLGFDLSGIGL